MVALYGRLCMVLCLTLSSSIVWAQASSVPKVVVVPVKGKGAPNLTPQMKPMVERDLADHADILPFKQFQKSAKKAKVKPKDFGSATAAATVGKELGATHIVIVESASEKIQEGKKKKVQISAKVTVVDVALGSVVATSTYVLKGKKLTKDVAATLVSETAEKLKPEPAPAPEPIAEVVPPPLPSAPPPPDAPDESVAAPAPPEGPAEPTLAAAPVESEPAADSTVSDPFAAAPAQQPAQPDEAPMVVAMTESAPAPEATLTLSEGIQDEAKNGAWRPGLVMRVGALGFLRRGVVNDSGGSDELTYGGDPFVAGLVQLEFYPLALGGKGRWYEGIGLSAEGQFTQAQTLVSAAPEKLVKSSVAGGQAGLSWRIVFWDSPKAIDLKIQGGFGMWQFPLKGAGIFPGVKYQGPYAGGELTLPLVEEFAFVVGGHYQPQLTVSGKAKNLGAIKSAAAFKGEAGFKLSFAPVEVMLMGRIAQYDATFGGASSLADGRDFENAKLSDRLLSGYLLVGVAL